MFKKLFKPSWIVIEVHHERYTFDTYYTYCRHMTLKEVEQMFMLDINIREKDKSGVYIYDECGDRWEGTYYSYTEDSHPVKLQSYGISYTIVIPYKNRKQDNWWICGHTKSKFGLFDREYIETSTGE